MGEKISALHNGMMPSHVILDPVFLESLPEYHKKSALLDALCQSIESLWANGRSAQSKSYALSAINIIYSNVDGYLDDNLDTTQRLSYALRMLQAANLSGKAINISKTTAAHAMSYKLTGMFGLAHGHAAALCLKYVWAHLLESGYVVDGLSEIDYDRFVVLFDKLGISNNFTLLKGKSNEIIDDLCASVNAQRLSNHPVLLSDQVLGEMYRGIVTNSLMERQT
jgi:alcohol dehydrogenase class IV